MYVDQKPKQEDNCVMYELILLGLIDGFSLFPIYMLTTKLLHKILSANGIVLILSAVFSSLCVGIFFIATHWVAGWPLANNPEFHVYFVVALILGSFVGKFVSRNKLKVP